MAGAQRAVPARGGAARRRSQRGTGAQLQGQVLQLDWARLEGEAEAGFRGRDWDGIRREGLMNPMTRKGRCVESQGAITGAVRRTCFFTEASVNGPVSLQEVSLL